MEELQPALEHTGSPGDDDTEKETVQLAETEDQFQTGNGQTVAYRVLQVGADGEEQTLITALPPGTQVAQAVLQSPFSGGGGEGAGDGTFTYIPSTSAGDADTVSQIQSQGGQFYVMMSPQDVLQGQRTTGTTQIRAATTGQAVSGKFNRDDRRRSTHNEVERRRRDKINNWIVALSKMIPDCGTETVASAVSKSGILSKACEYIQDLKNANLRLAESLKESETLSVENDVLRQQVEQSKEEISILRRTLEEHGIEPTGFTTADQQ